MYKDIGSRLREARKQKGLKQKTTKPAQSAGGKKDELKAVVAYLIANETFSDWLVKEFRDKWKPVIDNGLSFITNER